MNRREVGHRPSELRPPQSFAPREPCHPVTSRDEENDVRDPIRDLVEERSSRRLPPSLDGKHAVHKIREQAKLHECCGCGEQSELRPISYVREGGEASG